MRLALATVLAAALASTASTASARPVTLGAGLGSLQTSKDSEAGIGGSETLGVFGRVGLTRRIGVQAEVQRVDQTNSVSVRRTAALAVLELGAQGRKLVPVVLAGVGLDHAQSDYSQQEGHYVEAGLGLEYRVDGGLVISADFRFGERAQTQQSDAIAVPANAVYDLPYATSGLFSDGSYRSVRVGAGIRF